MQKSLIFLLLAFIFSFQANAQLAPLEAYGKLPKTSQVVISPSGDKIAYRVTEDKSDVFVVYDFTEKKIISGVNVSDIKPKYAYFVNETTLILVVSKNKRLYGYRGRHEISAAFSYNIETKKIKQLLVGGLGIHSGQTSLGRVVGISNDGKWAYMPAWETPSTYSLMRTKLEGQKRSTARRKQKGRGDAIDFFIYNDQVIARERFNNEENIHLVEVLEDGDWREVFREETEIKKKAFVGLTEDLTSLVVLAFNKTGRSAYYAMSLKTGKLGEPIFNPEDKDVESVLTDINRIVYGVRYSGFTPSYEFFDKKISDTVKQVTDMLPNISVHLVDHTPDWSKIIFLIEGQESAGDYYLYSDGTLSLIASQRPDIKPEQVLQVLETNIKARDGLRLPTLLTIPKVKDLKNLPAIILPHGGPESYDKIGFDWLPQYFASRGYLVVQPQFRGSKGFGADFTIKGYGEWGRKMQDDITDSVRTLVKSGYIDKDKVCIVGASYGGYAALAGAAFTPDIYQCAVSINGVADVAKMLRDEQKDYGEEHWLVAYWKKATSSGKFDDDHLEKISPINYVEQIKTPILLVHGTRDKVVPFHHSEAMYDELRDADKKVELVELPKGDHYLSTGTNRLQALEAIDKFIKQHI